MKVHIFSYDLGQKKFSKSRIYILPNYGQTYSKMAIVMLVRNTTDLQNLKWKPDNDAQAEKKAKESQIWVVLGFFQLLHC